LKKNYNYIITTGWWSTKDDIDNRTIKVGNSIIRSKEFHELWFQAIKKYTSSKKIFIIDSNSPVKPIMNEEDEVLISLLKNAGHSTNHIGKLCGVSRAHLLGMSLAMVNEVDYWVYVEQDALIYGDGIIEECIKQMKKPYMFGYGLGTPQPTQPTQQSLMIIKKEAIPKFIYNFNKIKAKDSQISPETKFAIATTPILQLISEKFFIKMEDNTKMGNFIKRVIWKLIDIFRDFDYLPIGYGRVRPINFDDKYFYFQHGDKEELDNFIKKHNQYIKIKGLNNAQTDFIK